MYVLQAVMGHPTCFDVVFGLAPKGAGVDHAYSPHESISGDKPMMLRFNELLLERGVHKADFKYNIVHADPYLCTKYDTVEAVAVAGTIFRRLMLMQISTLRLPSSETPQPRCKARIGCSPPPPRQQWTWLMTTLVIEIIWFRTVPCKYGRKYMYVMCV